VSRTHIRERARFAPGEVILYPGVPAPGEPVYRVVSGLVRIQHVDEEGNALTLRFVRPGEYFGEEALAGLERGHFAEALTESEVEAIPADELLGDEARTLVAGLVSALAQGYERIRRLVTQRLKNRIAAALLELKDTALAQTDAEGRPVIRLTHDDLAAAVGSVRETVTKVVGELAREGYIKSGYGKITLTDLKGLEDLASRPE